MTQEHPITPPPELVEQWFDGDEYELALKAAHWGADLELKACLSWLTEMTRMGNPDWPKNLRNARRPKPPSLKEQALGALYAIATGADDTREFYQDLETIKSALEQLDD